MKKKLAVTVKVGISFLMASAGLGQAQTYTNSNTTGTVLWSAGAWSPSVPVSSSTTVLAFGGTLTTAATLQNDLGTFNLTTLNDSHAGGLPSRSQATS